MTKNKTLFVFFALVFGFCGFCDSVSECENCKSEALQYIAQSEGNVDSIAYISSDVLGLSSDLNANGAAMSILSVTAPLNSNLASIRAAVNSIDCSSSNGTCSVDLGPVVEICSNIYAVVSSQYSFLVAVSNDLSYLASVFSYGNENTVIGDLSTPPPSYIRVWDESNTQSLDFLTSIVSNSFNSYLYSFVSLTNIVSDFYASYRYYNDQYEGHMSDFYDFMDTMNTSLLNIKNNVNLMYTSTSKILNSLQAVAFYVSTYLPYLQSLGDDFKSFLDIYTNSTTSFSYPTNLFKHSSVLSFDRFRYYAQGQLNNTQPSLYPLSPYDNIQNLRNATIYDAVAGGFESLLISQGSINNYLYWLKAIAGSNRLEAVENHIMAVSNLVGRLDDYVLTDFSNEIARISNNLSYLTNRVDYTTNLVHLTELVETNNSYLSSIDSKLDVLDYIKILSDTPLSSYSSDVNYYDYLTNLYINGSSSSGAASTNWFERMEILLASLVFGDSDGTNDIPQSVEMEGVDSSAVESFLSDYTYNQEFTGAINALDDTSQSFIGVLNGLHTSIKSVSLPASISIGLGGLDGEDTHNFEDMMHGHFQVSFNTGIADRFTIAVRAVTTISWILLFFLALWKSGFYLIRKLVYFYRLVTRLLVSVFTR